MVDVADDADRAELIRVFLECAELLGRGEALALGWWGRLGHIALMQFCRLIAATTLSTRSTVKMPQALYVASVRTSQRCNQALLAACETLASGLLVADALSPPQGLRPLVLAPQQNKNTKPSP